MVARWVLGLALVSVLGCSADSRDAKRDVGSAQETVARDRTQPTTSARDSLADAVYPADPGVPPEVYCVQSASDTNYTLRVVISNFGTEHVHSVVALQWLVDDAEQGPRLAASVAVKELGTFTSVGPPTIQWTGHTFRIVLDGTMTSTGGDTRLTLETGTPGHYSIVSSAPPAN